MIKRKCLICKKLTTNLKYCSIRCKQEGMKGHRNYCTDEGIRKAVETRKKLHIHPKTEWTKGQHPSPDTEFKKGYVPHHKIDEKDKIIILCARCNKKFKVNPSSRHRKYCSRSCMKVQRIFKICPVCNNKFITSVTSKKKYCSKNCMYNSAERNNKISISMSISRKGTKLSEKTKRKIKLKSIKNWQNPEYREKVVKNAVKGLLKRPTSFEKIIIDLIKEYNLPYKYVGDGAFLIGYKNPDFVEINGKKICVEVFYNYFKERDFGTVENYKEQRSRHFAKYGWKTIFIDEKQIQNTEIILKLLS